MRRSMGLVLCGAMVCSTNCYVRTSIDPGQIDAVSEAIVGVTTVEGDVIDFDPPGGTLSPRRVEGTVGGKPFGIGRDRVERYWVKRISTARTTALVVGLTVVGVVAVVAIAIAAKESCPFIYSWDGTQFVFDAEPYGGAITRGLERDDYSELENLVPVEGVYRLKVTNEVRETQFTNLFELWVIDHPPAARIAVDAEGQLFDIASATPPTSATDASGRELLAWLSETDRRIWEPAPGVDETGGVREEVILTFPKRHAGTVALVANVATGLWGSHMIREMLELRGPEVRAWYNTIDNDPTARERLLTWNLSEELYVLKIEVEEATGWETRGVLSGGGPFIAEDRVVVLDVSRAIGDDLRVRIRPPRGFWAFNSFAIADDSRDLESVHVQKLAPTTGIDSTGRDVRPALLADDDAYHVLPNTGDSATVEFLAPEPLSGMRRTVILHSRGYYRLHLSGEQDPNWETLNAITVEPDAAAHLAARLYTQWRQSAPGVLETKAAAK